MLEIINEQNSTIRFVHFGSENVIIRRAPTIKMLFIRIAYLWVDRGEKQHRPAKTTVQYTNSNKTVPKNICLFIHTMYCNRFYFVHPATYTRSNNKFSKNIQFNCLALSFRCLVHYRSSWMMNYGRLAVENMYNNVCIWPFISHVIIIISSFDFLNVAHTCVPFFILLYSVVQVTHRDLITLTDIWNICWVCFFFKVQSRIITFLF